MYKLRFKVHQRATAPFFYSLLFSCKEAENDAK